MKLNVTKNLNTNEIKEPKRWSSFFKKKYLGLIFISVLVLTLVLSLSLTLTKKDNEEKKFYAYDENCPYVIDIESEQYVGYGRIGMAVAFELEPGYTPSSDYVYVFETSENLEKETLVAEVPIKYDYDDDENSSYHQKYPYGVYSAYQYIPYNFSNHEKTYSIQIVLENENKDNVGTVELDTFALYDNREPNGFTISPFTNVLNYLNSDWIYGNCYLHYKLYYPEGSGKIKEVLLVDEYGNVVSNSKSITGKNFEYAYRGILYLPANHTSKPISYHIDIVYSHNIFPYSDLTKIYRTEIYSDIVIYPS